MDNNAILENIVRIGIVSAVDSGTRKARVQFDDMGITSGWLFVVQHYAAGIHVEPDNAHTHTITGTDSEGVSASMIPDHNHPGSRLTVWMPKVGERVLVLYIPIFNGDGFLLGGL